MHALRSVPEVLAQIGIGRSKVYELMRSGELEVVKIGRRTFIRAESVDAFVERHTQQNRRRVAEGSAAAEPGR